MSWLRSSKIGLLALVLPVLFTLAQSATVTHDFNITWVTANPDGMFARPVIGVNGKWPIPRIDINRGDRLIVNVYNMLGNQSTSFHWHGLFLRNNTHMDGPVQVTQCAIQPGSKFTYNFTVCPSPLQACEFDWAATNGRNRSLSPGRTGTTPTTRVNTLMASEDLWSCMIQPRHTWTCTTRRLS
jgi:hypothetical protein